MERYTTVHIGAFRLFKAALGQTPHQFVIAQRISLAKLMMLNSEKSLSEIAHQCGFANQAHFTTRFREMTDETPNTFKERMTKGKPKPSHGWFP